MPSTAIAHPDKAALLVRAEVLVKVVQRAKPPAKAKASRKEGEEWIRDR
jgi:hypothetical protein